MTVPRLTVDVDVGASALGISERSLRRALEPGGELAHLAIRVGRRVLIVRQRLEELVGQPIA